MYIYIEGKEPVARKSKSLAEMGVKDGDNLIVTTEMTLKILSQTMVKEALCFQIKRQ